jgi:hypothetical protein
VLPVASTVHLCDKKTPFAKTTARKLKDQDDPKTRAINLEMVSPIFKLHSLFCGLSSEFSTTDTS